MTSQTAASGAHRQIVSNMMLVAAFIVLGKAVGAVKELILAHRYGISDIVDVYVLSYMLTTWIPSIWMSVLAAVFVPIVLQLEEPARGRFRAQVFGLTLMLGICATLALALFAPDLASLYGDQFDAETLSTFGAFLREVSPVAGIAMLTFLFNAQLLANEQHYNTALEAIPSLVISAFVLLWAAGNGLAALYWGTLIGAMAHLLCCYIAVRGRTRFSPPQFRLNTPEWNVFKNSLGIMVAGSVIMSFIAPVDQYFAAQIGQGNVSIVGYGNRVVALFIGVFATALSRALLPVLSRVAESPDRALRLAIPWSAGLFALAWLFLWLLHGVNGFYIGVKLLFERGAFTENDTVVVSQFISASMFQLPFFLGGIVLVQLMSSLRAYGVLFTSCVVGLTSKVLANSLLVERYGVNGVGWSDTVMYACTFLHLVAATVWLGRRNHRAWASADTR